MSDDSSTLSLRRQAIQAALNCNWEEALTLNQRLTELEPESADCLNRLAKAYLELGKYTTAKKIYEAVLKLDPYNQIAEKNLKKVASLIKNGSNGVKNNTNHIILSPELFLHEPGVTKLVTLIKVAEPQRLLSLSTGTMVSLIVKNRGISVTDSGNQYLGALPDDIAHHLLKLLKGGNKYQALIKSIKPNSLTILIRETFRSKKFRNQASFLDEAKTLAFSSDHLPYLADKESDHSEELADSDDIITS